MFVDFDEVFNKSVDYSEKLTDKSPCKKCEERNYFINNPYFQSKKCEHCKENVLWQSKCLEKLAYLEEHQDGNVLKLKEVIDGARDYLEYYLIDNMKYKDSQKEFKKLLQMLDKVKDVK